MNQLTLAAFYHRTGVIEATLKKSYYSGVSSLFRLYTPQNESIELKQISKKDLGDSVVYELQCPPLEMGQDYVLSDAHHLTTIVQMGFIVREPWFDKQFAYDGDDLGAVYTSEFTDFKVWAPTASELTLSLFIELNRQVYPMSRGEKGTWSVRVFGNLENALYRYIARLSGQIVESIDPYGYSASANGHYSAVINLAKTYVDLKNEKLPPLESPVDAVIYELHVRDFSIDPNGQMTEKGKFNAFLESGTHTTKGRVTGMDYLRFMGFTHVQLLPIYDFGSVDDLYPKDYYNWGYDPVQFSVPEGSYSTDVKNPLTRIIEVKQMISAFHQHGIRVNMDVVYNHMFDMPTSSFQRLVPNYYFRFGTDGSLSNGSFCGNDFDSTRSMGRKFIVDSCVRWVKDYGINGLRFDLMGIIDLETMKAVDQACRLIRPDFMIYGEGWNMPTLIPDEIKTSQLNNMQVPTIGFFSDRFREVIKGSTSHHEIERRGYATGDIDDLNLVKDVLSGSCTTIGKEPFYQQPSQVINYTECHDNSTNFDKVIISNAHETEEIRQKRLQLIIAITLVAQGIPFLHAGQEFLRTKNGVHNSYMSSDAINHLDWSRMEKHYDVVLFTKDMIELRRHVPELRLKNAKEIQNRVSFEVLENGALLYHIKPCKSSLYSDFRIFINPTLKVIYYHLDEYYHILANESGTPKFDLFAQNLMINPVSLVIVALPKK